MSYAKLTLVKDDKALENNFLKEGWCAWEMIVIFMVSFLQIQLRARAGHLAKGPLFVCLFVWLPCTPPESNYTVVKKPCIFTGSSEKFSEETGRVHGASEQMACREQSWKVDGRCMFSIGVPQPPQACLHSSHSPLRTHHCLLVILVSSQSYA